MQHERISPVPFVVYYFLRITSLYGGFSTNTSIYRGAVPAKKAMKIRYIEVFQKSSSIYRGKINIAVIGNFKGIEKNSIYQGIRYIEVALYIDMDVCTYLHTHIVMYLLYMYMNMCVLCTCGLTCWRKLLCCLNELNVISFI